MSQVYIGVLALQGAVSEHVAILQNLGLHVSLVKKPSELLNLQGLVIPGGESTAITRLAAPSGLLQNIRARIDDGSLAVFGTCAGLILLADEVHAPDSPKQAESLAQFDRIGGLDVIVARNAYGNQLDSFEADLEFYPHRALPSRAKYDSGSSLSEDQPSVVSAAFIRAPRIESVGPLAQVIAVHKGEPVAVVQGNLLGATFHPEITNDNQLHRVFVDMASHVLQQTADTNVVESDATV